MATGDPKQIKKKPRQKSPFKNQETFEKEITEFANRFKTTVVNQSSRISDYFEMSCFNMIVKFYELYGYKATIENLQDGQYKYKCTTSGIQSNFSHFKVYKEINETTYEFQIQHNLAIQSSQDKELFTTPDIAIVMEGSVKYSNTHYDSKRLFSYVENEDLLSFCEVKQFTPFPELLFNFIGIVNELRHKIMNDTSDSYPTKHIAPSLMISGKPSKPVARIKASLERRYCINLIFDLFYSSTKTFSKKNLGKLRKAGRLPAPKFDYLAEFDEPF
jgi:hypothetical protein